MTTATDLVATLRAADPRVDVVVRAFVLQRLGLTDDDLPSTALAELLRHPAGTALVIGAVRLLERLDAQLARAHPVDVDYLDVVHDVPHAVVAVARVPLGDEDAYDVALCRDGSIVLDRDVDPWLTAVDAEALAYALLRLTREAAEATDGSAS